MDRCTDSNSDLDEELPCVLMKPPQNVRPSDRQPIKSSARCDVNNFSSDSDDDAPYVPLALRLQQKRSNGGGTGRENVPYRIFTTFATFLPNVKIFGIPSTTEPIWIISQNY